MLAYIVYVALCFNSTHHSSPLEFDIKGVDQISRLHWYFFPIFQEKKNPDLIWIISHHEMSSPTFWKKKNKKKKHLMPADLAISVKKFLLEAYL